MKRRKKKRGRKRVYVSAPPKVEQAVPPSFPVAIQIYKKWIDKENNCPVDFGTIMCACTLALQEKSGQFPFSLQDLDDNSRTVYLRVAGVEPLTDFQMVQAVDADSEEGQETAKAMEIFRDIMARSSQYSESRVEEAIGHVLKVGDKVRIPLVYCDAGEDNIRGMVPEEQVDADNWNDLPALHIASFQRVFEDLLGYLLSGTVIDGEPDADIAFAGDRRWVVQGGELDTFMQQWQASRMQTV